MSGRGVRTALAVALCAAVAAVVAFGTWVAARPERTLERIRRTGVVRVGYAVDAPFAYRAADGRVTGESPEIARVVLGPLGGRRIEWVQAEFRALIPGLVAGRFDVVASGMFATPERAQLIAFSTPTYSARTALLVRRGDEARLGGYDRIREAPEARLAVLDGAYEERLAAAARIPAARVLRVPDAVTGVAAVRSGRADAFALTAFSVVRLAQGARGGGLGAVVLPDTEVGGVPAIGHGAFGFRRDDAELREAFDRGLRRYLDTPAHLALVRQFGFDGAALAPAGGAP